MENKETEKYEGEVHVYDGIVEHDNHLPSWWLATFYGGVVFGVFYAFYYMLGNGPTLTQEYQRDLWAHEAIVAAQQASKPQADDAQLIVFAKDPARLKIGKEVFASKCLACHGAQGQGSIGPNLTDDYWIHGAKHSQLVNIVMNGVADKGMPPWAALLKTDEIYSVVGYIKTLRGTNPPGAKASQGELVKE